MSNILNASIFFDGHIALEWEECTLTENPHRRRLESMLLDIEKGGHSSVPHWLIVLGLCDTATALSPSLDFWRTFAAAWGLLYSN